MRREKVTKVKLFMETTSIEPSKTMAEIQEYLKDFGLRQFVATFGRDGEVDGCFFVLAIGGNDVPFKIPIRWEPIHEMAKQKRTRYVRDERQARRVAWRQVLRWIQAQLALVYTGMVDVQEVFLPYVVDKSGDTLYKSLSNGDFFKNYKALGRGSNDR